MKNLFKINVYTYLFLILSMLSGYMKDVFIIFLILVIHELGHFFLMRINGIEINSITIYPYGGMIKSNMLINTNSFKVLLISLGGIISQLFLILFLFIINKFGLMSDYYEIFIKYNMVIILFNLIPIYPLDGYKIINSLLELFMSFKHSIYITMFINVIFLIFFIIYLYIYKISNYMIIIFLLLSLFKFIREIKYLFNKFYIERILYDIDYVGLISVSNISEIHKNKYNYINGIDEKKYLNNMFYN